MIAKCILLLIISVAVTSAASSITRDKIIVEEVERQSQPIASQTDDDIIGTSRVYLDGNCGSEECNLGNFIADSFVDWNAQHFESQTAWTDAAVAMVEARAIRKSFEDTGNGLKMEDIEACLAGERVVVVQVSGAVVKDALENSVSRYERGKSFSEFLQLSGMNVVYNVSKPSGERVESVELICADCLVPVLGPLDPNRVYGVLMQESMAKNNPEFRERIVKTMVTRDSEMFADYLRKKSPIYPAVEWRVTVVGAASGMALSFALLLSSTLLALFNKFLL